MDELLIYMLTSQRMWDIQSVLSESFFFFYLCCCGVSLFILQNHHISITKCN